MKRFLSLFVSVLFVVGAWSQNTENGHEYVDLGLPSKTLWATTNIGADGPEKFGCYFAWGEIERKDDYRWRTYLWMNHSINSEEGCNKYTFADNQTNCSWYNSDEVFIGDNKKELDSDDDVAAIIWGGNWRIPSLEQQQELLSNCYWVWTTIYDSNKVNGYIVFKAKRESDKGVITKTSSSDYNVDADVHLFLPAAGNRYQLNYNETGQAGFYWSRTIGTYDSQCAMYMKIGASTASCDYHFRCHGNSVRPVYKISGVPTAVDITKADMTTKIVKTIENGRIVIIRNGERYDIAGRKL